MEPMDGSQNATTVNLADLIVEKSVHGHVHIDELYLTFPPLRTELKSTYGDSKERDFWSAEVKYQGVRARIYFRHFPESGLLTLDWIYIPKSLRRRNIGYHLLHTMIEHFPNARRVHLLLAHGNLRAYQEGATRTAEEKVRSAPTIRQLTKLGFKRIEYVGQIEFPKDKKIYPEVVVTREDYSEV
jgi:GNAT superfamily N-acetyltransferase